MSGNRKPPPHTSSGYGPLGSGGGNKAMVTISILIFGIPFLLFLTAVAYVVIGNLS